ncbi:MAG: Thiol-disulfide oxidoreductase ResA [Actinomycetota bacterium]
MQAKYLVRNSKFLLSFFLLTACASPNASIQNSGDAGFISGDGSATFLKVEERESAPKLQATSFNGETIDLNSYKNKVIVLNVWGSWCAPCRKEAKEIQDLYLKNKSSGVEFIGINIRDSKVSAEKFISNFEITYPNIYDRDGVLLLGFKDSLPANAIPSTVLIDKNGLVAARQLGPIDRALIQGFISSLVDE